MNLIPLFIRRRIANRPNLAKIAQNIGWLFFDKILRMGVGVFVGVWVARYLGPQQFGLLNFASAFTGVFGILAGLGLQSIVVRNIVINRGIEEETLGTASVLQFVAGVIIYFLTLVSILLLRPNDQNAIIIVSILGLMTLYKAADVAVFWFESQVLSKYTIWVQNGVFLCFAAVKYLLIVEQAPLISFVWAMMIESLLVAMLMMLMLSMHGPSLSKLKFTIKRSKELLSESWPLLLSSLSIMVYMKIDQIMLGQMIGDEAVGIYSAALRISEIWYFVPMGIVASVFPAIVEAKKHSEKRYYKRLQQLYDLMAWFSIAIAVPMTFLSSCIVRLLYGNDFSAAGDVLAIHIWAAVFVFIGVASSRWFIMENRQILSLKRSIIGAVINIILNIFFIPSYGVIGAAWATVIAQFSVGILFDFLNEETHPMLKMKLRAFNPFRILSIIKGNLR